MFWLNPGKSWSLITGLFFFCGRKRIKDFPSLSISCLDPPETSSVVQFTVCGVAAGQPLPPPRTTSSFWFCNCFGVIKVRLEQNVGNVDGGFRKVIKKEGGKKSFFCLMSAPVKFLFLFSVWTDFLTPGKFKGADIKHDHWSVRAAERSKSWTKLSKIRLVNVSFTDL